VDKENLITTTNITTGSDGTVINGIKWLIPDKKCDIGCKKDDICDPDCKCTAMKDPDCAAFVPPKAPYYKWEFFINPNSEMTVSYRVKPLGIGTIEISPTVATTSIGEFLSNSLTIKVKCNGNRICERNENYANCPEDCKSGLKDGYCDRVKDGACDPDCAQGLDPDCEITTTTTIKPVLCGDGICDETENYANCPNECPSGGKDNYCDAIKDGLCDPDCLQGLDPDCVEKCGNGMCETGENYANCPKDCKSGSRDGYCDRVKDGVCDQDCKSGEDEDCRKGDYLIYLIAFLILVPVLWIAYKRIRR
jgi:hypothetical protein